MSLPREPSFIELFAEMKCAALLDGTKSFYFRRLDSQRAADTPRPTQFGRKMRF
jgi:hypothetical protein